MIRVGDKVKLNIEKIIENGMGESEEQVMKFEYIVDHPDEIYEVASISSPIAIAQISLNHPVLYTTSFFDEEIIPVRG